MVHPLYGVIFVLHVALNVNISFRSVKSLAVKPTPGNNNLLAVDLASST